MRTDHAVLWCVLLTVVGCLSAEEKQRIAEEKWRAAEEAQRMKRWRVAQEQVRLAESFLKHLNSLEEDLSRGATVGITRGGQLGVHFTSTDPSDLDSFRIPSMDDIDKLRQSAAVIISLHRSRSPSDHIFMADVRAMKKTARKMLDKTKREEQLRRREVESGSPRATTESDASDESTR